MLLNINKPRGVTSRDVVNVVDRLVQPARSGHAGTLDPLATGVLVVCIGSATRLVPYVQRMRKRYRAVFRLGLQSDTDDLEGHVIAVEIPIEPTREQLIGALARFQGSIAQVPPDFSAIKVHGQRAYKLARRNQPVDLAPRMITIYTIELLEYRFPDVHVDVECSAGTYIRALGRDLGAALGTSAVMTELTRTAVGSFTIDEAVRLESLTVDSLSTFLRPSRQALSELPCVEVDREEARRLLHGQAIRREQIPIAEEMAILDADGTLIAIVNTSELGVMRPLKCFPPNPEPA